jgi:hypothetical protein
MIVNVDRDFDVDWPLEVIGHDGKANNVTTEPGDIVPYESHAVIHGRPFTLFFLTMVVGSSHCIRAWSKILSWGQMGMEKPSSRASPLSDEALEPVTACCAHISS